MVSAVLLIVTDQLFRVSGLAGHLVLDEVDEPLGVGPVLEMEIQALSVGFVPDVDAFFLSVVLQDKLLQEQECSFVVHFLSHLHLTLPQMRCVGFLTVITLLVSNYEFAHESLLEKGSIQNFFLDRDFYLESSTVGLSPDEWGVNHFYSLQTLNMFETEGKQLRWLKFTLGPGWSLVSIALFAMVQLHRLRYSLSNVHFWL